MIMKKYLCRWQTGDFGTGNMENGKKCGLEDAFNSKFVWQQPCEIADNDI